MIAASCGCSVYASCAIVSCVRASASASIESVDFALRFSLTECYVWFRLPAETVKCCTTLIG